MTEQEFPGPMTMVRIDGAKIKRLRERQGLTQLYLATAVEVTTDTISRWENRRYPSIKKENGLKLAEALNVDLAELLETEEDGPAGEDDILPGTAAAPLPPPGGRTPPRSAPKIWPLLLLSATIALILLAFIFVLRDDQDEFPVAATRILPPHTPYGLPFPVLIEVRGDPDQSTTLIIKENLPAGAILMQTAPEITVGSGKNNQLKWLKKINGTAIFAYVIRVDPNTEGPLVFSGNAAVSATPERSPAIGGTETVALGNHHWADYNRDNIISDDEILAVYDRYGDLDGVELGLDLIEEIWLGSGYGWNSATATFDIVD